LVVKISIAVASITFFKGGLRYPSLQWKQHQ
jgi:hypothetical protein